MDLHTIYVIYLLAMLATAVLNFALIVYGWRHQHAPGATGFMVIMAASGGYALFNILVIVAPTRASTVLVAKAGFICAAALAPAWLIFALQFSRRRAWLTWRRQLPLVAPQIIVLLSVWTNEWHKGAWAGYIFQEVGHFLLLDVVFGPVMWIGYGYTFLTVVAGALILARSALEAGGLYRRQAWMVLAAASFPLLFSLLYVFRAVDLLNVDFIPLGFALSGMAVVWGMWRYRPFRLVPTARTTLIENMEEGVIVLDHDYHVIDVNEATRRILALSSSGVIGRLASQVLPDWLELPLASSTPQTVTVDVQQPRPDGAVRYFELKVTPIQEEETELGGWLLLLHDITARKHVEAQLRQQTRELETLSQVSAAMRTVETVDEMMQVGLARAVEGLHAAFGSIFLWDKESDLLRLRASYPPDASDETITHQTGEGITGHVAVTGERYVTENVLMDARANILPEELPLAESMGMRAQLSLPLRVQESVIGVMHVGLRRQRPFHPDEIRLATAVADITASGIHRALMLQGLEAEVAARTAEIRAEQEKQTIILNSVNDAIVMTDLAYCIRYVNEGFTHLTGYEAETVQRRNVVTLLGGAMEASQRHLLQQALQEARPWQGEVTLVGKHGRVYEAALVVAPVRDGDGDLIGFVFSHQDISHLKELEQARTQFMVNVSHQLRTPVANIKLYTDLLRMGQEQPDKKAHYLEVLAAQTGRLEHLVGDILEMTALDGGRGLLTWEPIPVGQLLETTGARYRSEAEEAGIELKVRPLPSALPHVQGDENRLAQALSELLTNALAFTPPGGSVELSARHVTEEERRFIAISVQDSGPGVPFSEQSRIFERFYRGGHADDGSTSGTGLGLSIVKEIMRLHGGRVTVRSRAEVGSRFTLWLPILAEPSENYEL